MPQMRASGVSSKRRRTWKKQRIGGNPMTIIEFYKVFARSSPVLFGIMVLIFIGIIAGMIYEELTE